MLFIWSLAVVILNKQWIMEKEFLPKKIWRPDQGQIGGIHVGDMTFLSDER